MATWWMPVKQLAALRKISDGDCMCRNPQDDTYWWSGGKKCTPQGRALYNKGFIAPDFGIEYEIMHITPTGKNEMGYNRHREID